MILNQSSIAVIFSELVGLNLIFNSFMLIGVYDWDKHFPCASGSNQTPIDIVQSKAVHDIVLATNQIEINYEKNFCNKITNTGSSFQFTGSSIDSTINGGPIGNESYRFLQFHMHWGRNDSEGSEHLVDGKQYAAEIHFVNWNYHMYKDVGEAVQSSSHGGLCVIGVFVNIGNKKNSELEKVISSLDSIKYKNQSSRIDYNININKMLPSKFINLNYFISII
jgi:carbonic anhydrase